MAQRPTSERNPRGRELTQRELRRSDERANRQSATADEYQTGRFARRRIAAQIAGGALVLALGGGAVLGSASMTGSPGAAAQIPDPLASCTTMAVVGDQASWDQVAAADAIVAVTAGEELCLIHDTGATYAYQVTETGGIGNAVAGWEATPEDIAETGAIELKAEE